MPITQEELYLRIKDQNVGLVFADVELQLRLSPPNGARVHEVAGLRQGLFTEAETRRDYNFPQCPRDETFEGYLARDEERCNHYLSKLTKAVNEWGVKI